MNDHETPAPQAWFDGTPAQAGSWWPIWQQWLVQHSTQARLAPPPLGSAAAGYAAIGDAPGTYVFQK
jgi:polyhydroxyalkanoate synthase